MAESSVVMDHQPRAGCWLLAIPVIGTVVVIGAYIGITVLGVIGHPADGARVTMQFATCADAVPLIEARAEMMGLGDVQATPDADGVAITATLPADEGVAARIPATLAMTADFAVVDGATGGRIADGAHVDSAVPHLKLTGSPVTLVGLDDEGRRALALFVRDHPDGRVALELDGVRHAEIDTSQAPSGDDIELPADADDPNLQLELAAGRAIAITHGPLPCPAQVGAMVPVTDPDQAAAPSR